MIRILCLLLALPAAAQQAALSLTVELWDDPELPLYRSPTQSSPLVPGWEFDMPENPSGSFRTVPVLVDFQTDGLILEYPPGETGSFTEAVFNGYVFGLDMGCRITGAKLDEKLTTLPLEPSAIRFAPEELRIHVAGLSYAPGDRIVVALDTDGCAPFLS